MKTVFINTADFDDLYVQYNAECAPKVEDHIKLYDKEYVVVSVKKYDAVPACVFVYVEHVKPMVKHIDYYEDYGDYCYIDVW